LSWRHFSTKQKHLENFDQKLAITNLIGLSKTSEPFIFVIFLQQMQFLIFWLELSLRNLKENDKKQTVKERGKER
jgi:hypothetical protein